MPKEEYDPRPQGRYVSFADRPGNPPAPYDWPQDTLRVPNGFGTMPLVNHLNENRARREFFEVGAHWNLPGYDTVNVQNLQLPRDGDFWCSSISVATINPAAASPDQAVATGIVAYVMIEDGVTGYSLTQSYQDDSGTVLIRGAPWASFETRSYNLSTGLGPFTQPFGGGVRTDMIEPYCFLRGGALKVTLTIPPNGGPVFPSFMPQCNFYISFAGWKEYAYAAA